MSRGTWILVGVWAVAVALVDPRADVPLIDDWTYAFSVERLLEGRGFQVSAWSSTFPAAQIWWGTLFAAVGGFSHTALRLSTLTVALLGALAMRALLLALGCGAGAALLGALVLLLYPVSFVLSFTFMTDVPMVAASCTGLWLAARGLRDARLGMIGLGLLAALVAFLVRPVAIALPAAVLAALWWHPDRALRRGGAVVGFVALALMIGAAVGAARLWPYAGEGGLAYRVERLRYLLLVSPAVYLEALLSMLAHLGLAVVPALLVSRPRVGRWPWRTTALLLAAAAVLSRLAPEAVSALKPAHTWSLQELGAGSPLLRGAPSPSATRHALALVATIVGLGGAAYSLARVADALQAGGVLRQPPWILVALFGLFSAGLCFVLWLFYDRYYLPMVPAAIALALAPGRETPPPRRLRAAVVLMAALAILDVTGSRDMLAHARAVDAATMRLHAAGVPFHRVDAGYVLNGWRLYAHAENLPPGARPERDVSHVTSDTPQPFVLAHAPLAGYHVRETIDVPTWWRDSDRLYVLAASGAPDPSLAPTPRP